jgi:hypothetical protein
VLNFKHTPYIFFALFVGCSTTSDRVFVEHKNVDDKSFVKEFKKSNKLITKFESKTIKHSKKKNAKKKLKKVKIKRSIANVPTQEQSTYSPLFRRYDEEYEKAMNLFQPLVEKGEVFVFAVSYFGVTAGHIRLKTLETKEIDGKRAYHFNANLRSARFYSTFYELNDSIDSYVEVDDFKPLKYSLVQRESAQDVDDLQIFDHDNFKTHVFYKRLKKGKRKVFQKVIDIPKSFQDSYSAIHFVRGLPLVVGDYYELPVVTRGKVWLLKAWVDEVEEIEVMGEDTMAIKLRVETHFPGVLAKTGNIFFWFSDDDKKRLLRFDAKVKIGTISGELVEYLSGQ